MMTARSTKRQRSSTVYLCDEEPRDESPRYNEVDSSLGASSTTLSGKRRSPESPSRKKSVGNKSIRGYFERSNPENARIPSSSINGNEDDDDIIDDYDSYDELFNSFADEDTSRGRNSVTPATTQSQSHQLPSHTANRTTRRSNPPKRFIVPLATDRRKKSPPPTPSLDGQLPWAQRYPPRDLDELAVHKKKVADVNNWIKDALRGNSRHKLLVLRGPAGSGKTTTVSLLAESLGLEIVEWKNPPVSDYTSSDYVSVSKRFDEFLDRGNSYGGLELDSEAGLRGDTHNVNTPHTPHRVILIEEFPTLNRNSPSLGAFRLALQRCLATSGTETNTTLPSWQRASGDTRAPIVIIVSETQLNSDSSLSDNITVHRLLGAEICRHPNTTIIDFNSIAPTFMYKALGLVLDKDARYSGNHTKPSHSVLQAISRTGDIRSAINSLEFLRLRPGAAKSLKAQSRKGKSLRKTNQPANPTEVQALESIAQRENSLGIFHAVGKIVYNKRQETDAAEAGGRQPSPPPHLSQHDRPEASQVSVDELIDETGTDVQTFVSALHENYVPSCDGASFIECTNGCIDALSDSDLLSASNRNGTPSRPATKAVVYRSNAGLDVLRQDELSFQVATRGLLFSLPHPVKRCSRPTGHSGRRYNAHQMYFPALFRLVHDMEEINDLVGIWRQRLLDPFRGLAVRSVQSSTSRRRPNHPTNNEKPTPVTMTSRSDLLLYQLPYMAAISSDPAETQELQQLTRFGETHSDVLEGDSDYLQTELADPSTNDETSKPYKLKSSSGNRSVFGPQLPVGNDDREEKLILSDDDILDD